MKMSSVSIQEKINELNRIERSSEHYLNKYNEILRSIVSLKEIYTVVSRNTTDEEVKDNKGKIFFGLNNNMPTMWLFSEEKIAKEYAEYYQFKRNDIYLVKKVEFQELLISSYYAMFSGIYQVIIDEGRDFIICNIYDLVNECFVKQGQPPVLAKSEYAIMNVLNSVRFCDDKLWIVPSKDTIGEEIILNKFAPVVEKDYIKVFISEKDCKKYSKEQGNTNEIAIDMNMSSLQNIIKVTIDNNIKNVRFLINDSEVKMSTTKLYNILQRMNGTE